MVSWLKSCWQRITRAGQSPARPQPRARPSPPPPPPPPPPESPVLPPDPLPPPAPQPGAPAASFSSHRFAWEGRAHPYRLFIPAGPASAARPLLVMLHGCRQDSADFARGTDMNRLAQERGCLVLYPEQTPKANRMRCWNWYDKAHQGHAGEPAMIAALTRQVAQALGADPGRICVSGLSAGGAMAAVVAALYPELFAALGVHSGIPAGAATDVISAFTVMRRGATTQRPFAGRRDGLMPTIVFHGSADSTVHPDNSEQLVALALQALRASGLELTRSDQPLPLNATQPQARTAQRSRWLGPDGKSYLEHWSVDQGPHAWSGGQEGGSFTDPQGPDASAAMLEFFLQHRRG